VPSLASCGAAWAAGLAAANATVASTIAATRASVAAEQVGLVVRMLKMSRPHRE
jgi:hypothetical protein